MGFFQRRIHHPELREILNRVKAGLQEVQKVYDHNDELRVGKLEREGAPFGRSLTKIFAYVSEQKLIARRGMKNQLLAIAQELEK